MSDPVVSVVMGVYNGVDLLPESVESILSQEGVDLEFVIIDDGSTDGAGALLDVYAARDRRVRVVHQENTGLTRALIRGCREARGEYIARQDNGDHSLPGRLRRQREALDAAPELAFVSCWTEFCGPRLEYLGTVRGTGVAAAPCRIIDPDREKLVSDGPSCHPSVMFRQRDYERAGGYHPQFYVAQDWDLWYRLAEVGSFLMIPAPLYRARLLPGSVSGELKPEQRELVRLSREALRRRLAGEPEGELLAAAARIVPRRQEPANRAGWCYFIGERLRRNGDRRALGYFREVLREEPLSGRAWLRLLQTLLGGSRTPRDSSCSPPELPGGASAVRHTD